MSSSSQPTLSPCLLILVHKKSHIEAPTDSRQRRDTRLNSFQLLPQLDPNPILQLRSLFATSKTRRRRDYTIRHVLAMGLRSCASTVHERTRTNFGSASQDFDGDTGNAAVVLTVEFTLAKAGRSEWGLAMC